MSSKNPIPENNPEPNTKDKAAEQSSTTPNEVPKTAALSKSNPEKSQSHCQITCKQERDWLDHLKTVAEFLGLILLGVYTGYTIKMYRANKDAADAAKSAADTAARQLDLSTRPWVGIKGIIRFENFLIAPVSQSDFRMNVNIVYALENSGNSPARRVAGEMVAKITSQNALPNEWRSFTCDSVEQISIGNPNPDFGTLVVMPKDSIEMRLTTNTPIPSDVKQVTVIWVIGCIAYQDTVGKMHHTKLLYRTYPTGKLHTFPPTVRDFSYFDVGVIQLTDSDAD